MIYMNGKNDLADCARFNYQQIASVGSTDLVNLVVELGLLSWDRSYRIRATPAATLGASGPAQVPGVVDLGKINMGDQQTLCRFIAAAKRDYPALHYVLIIWDHGSGWRLTADQLLLQHEEWPAKTALATGQASAPTAQNVRVSRLSNPRSISRDDEYCTRLFDRDVQTALEADPVDIIGFDACLMSMVETAHALRLGAQWMIGSEEEIPGTGWKYDDWLATLTQKPTLSVQELCKVIGESYSKAYGPNPQAPYTNDPTMTFSSVDLGRVRTGHMVAAISRLADRLIDVVVGDDGLLLIKAARADCAEYAPDFTRPGGWARYQHVDIVRFCQQLIAHSHGQEPELERLAAVVIDEVRRSVAMRWCGKNRCDGDPIGQRWGSHGLAIYFPSTKQIFESDLQDPKIGRGYEIDNTDHPVEFVSDRNIHWASFIQFFINKVPK